MNGMNRIAMGISGIVVVGVILALATPKTVHAEARALAEPAQDPDCNVLFDAVNKLSATPNHAYITETRGANGKPTSSEGILVGGVRYIRVNDKWMKSPISEQQMQEQERENRQNAKEYSCRYLRDESVQGTAASVYSAHQKQEGFATEAQIWISKSTGLILREEEDIDTGGGPAGKSHQSIRYEYRNVQAPAVSH